MSECSGDNCPWVNEQVGFLGNFLLLERRGCKKVMKNGREAVEGKALVMH